MDERSARRAANEAVFRAGNERIHAVVGDALPRARYMCECGEPGCFEPVELTVAEYEGVRAYPRTRNCSATSTSGSRGSVSVCRATSCCWTSSVSATATA